MRSLTELSVRSLRRRPARFALTGAGAALGVAVLFAVLITSGATTAALDDAMSGSAGEVDVFVGPVGSFDATLAPALVDQVAALDGVETALGSVTFRSSAWPVTEGTAPPVVSRDNILFVVGTDLDRRPGPPIVRPARRGACPRQRRTRSCSAAGSRTSSTSATGDDDRARRPPGGSQVVTISGILSAEGAGLGFQGARRRTPRRPRPSACSARATSSPASTIVLGGRPRHRRPGSTTHREAIGESLTIQDADDAAAPTSGSSSWPSAAALMLMAAIAMFVGGFLVFLTFTDRRRRAHAAPTAPCAPSARTPPRCAASCWREAVGARAHRQPRRPPHRAAPRGRQPSARSKRLLDLELQPLGFPLGAAFVGVAVGVGGQRRGGLAPGPPGLRDQPDHAIRGGRRRQSRAAAGGGPAPWCLAVGLVIAAGIGEGVRPPRASRRVLVLLGAVLLVPFVVQPVARVVGGPITHRLAGGAGLDRGHAPREGAEPLAPTPSAS